MLIKHPIDYEKVCNCAHATFIEDSKLREFLNMAPNDTNTDKVSSYVTIRLVSSMMACIAPELDAALVQTDLLK